MTAPSQRTFLLGLGAQKAGTAWMHRYLESSPQCDPGFRKEYHVWDAVDLPSGLDCDTGLPLGPCVRADITGTFVARKRGFDRPESAAFTGRVHVLDIGVPRRLLADSAGVGKPEA